MQFQEQVWDVHVETLISGEEKKEVIDKRFRTFRAAKECARSHISKLDISSCTDALRNDEGWAFRNAVADFLKDLIARGCVLDSKEDIPSLSRKDYSVPDYHGFRIQGEDPAPPLKIETNVLGTHLKFLYKYGPEYEIDTDILLPDLYSEDYVRLVFQYTCPKAPDEAYVSYQVTLKGVKARSTAPNAVKIVELLRQSKQPLTQTQIAERLGIDRKTVGSHIRKLEREGTYPIQRAGKRGYFVAEKADGLTYEDMKIIKQSVENNPRIQTNEKERLLELLSKL